MGEVEGRVAGPAKTLMDANVYDLMAEEEMPPPPPYTSTTDAHVDDHKPEWMYSPILPPPVDTHRHQHGGGGHENAGYDTEDEGESKALPWHREDEAVLQQQQHFPAGQSGEH